MLFDHTSLPWTLRTWSRIEAAVETCRLTFTGLVEVGAGDWTMRSAPTTTAASFDAPVSATVVGELLALETTFSVAFLGPIGSAGTNVTLSLQVFAAASGTLQVPRSTVKSALSEVAEPITSGALPSLRTATAFVTSGSPIRRVPKAGGLGIVAWAAVATAVRVPVRVTVTLPASVGTVSVAVLAPAAAGEKPTVTVQVPPPPSTTVVQPSVVTVKSAALAPVMAATPAVRKPPPELRMTIAFEAGPVPTASEPKATGEPPTTTALAGPPAPFRAGSLIENVCHRVQSCLLTGSLAMQKRSASMF